MTGVVGSSRVGAPGLVLAGAALFGTVGTAQALGPDVPEPQLAAVRLLLAAVLLVTVAALTSHWSGVLTSARRAPTWFAAVAQAGFNLCFLGAMTHAGVAVGTLVAIGATPILTGLVTRKVSSRWLVATGIALGGLILLVGGQISSGQPVSVLGIVLAVGAAASYATYIIAGTAASSREMETQPYLAAAFVIAAVVTMPLLMLGDVTWVGTTGGSLLVIYLAVVPTLLAYSMFNRGLGGVRSSTASTLGLIEPVVAAGLAMVVLGERLSILALAGAALILVGLVMIVRTSDSNQEGHETRTGMTRGHA